VPSVRQWKTPPSSVGHLSWNLVRPKTGDQPARRQVAAFRTSPTPRPIPSRFRRACPTAYFKSLGLANLEMRFSVNTISNRRVRDPTHGWCAGVFPFPRVPHEVARTNPLVRYADARRFRRTAVRPAPPRIYETAFFIAASMLPAVARRVIYRTPPPTKRPKPKFWRNCFACLCPS